MILKEPEIEVSRCGLDIIVARVRRNLRGDVMERLLSPEEACIAVHCRTALGPKYGCWGLPKQGEAVKA